MNNFPNRRWLIIPTTDIDKINFDEVLQISPETLRLSKDQSKTFIKYDIYTVEEDIIHNTTNPETGDPIINTVSAGTYGRPSIYEEGMKEYLHEEILEVLSTEEWILPDNLTK
jgi:dynactin complex subunit